MRRLSVYLLAVLSLSTTLGAAAQSSSLSASLLHPALSDTLQPSPELSPKQVVEIQLEALRNNDADDKGIEVVFRFASPANRAQTGPLPRFAKMLKSGAYALMLNYESVIFDDTSVAGDKAEQRVVLINKQQKLGYSFVMSRQNVAPYQDCWMTELVGVVQIGGAMALGESRGHIVASAHP